VGTLLLGASYLAIGLFASSLTENQIVAFILAMILCFVFAFFGIFSMQGILPSGLESVFSKMSLSIRFQSIQRGVLDSRDIIFYLSIILFFLYLNVLTIRHRR
jgi:ABC-2 type transport system permease protein